MKKLASLFISFTLLFTQLVPLAQSEVYKPVAIVVNWEEEQMLNDPTDLRWLSAKHLEKMVSFLNRYPSIAQQAEVKELIRKKVDVISDRCKNFFFVASQVFLPMDPLCDADFDAPQKLLTIIEQPFEFNGIQAKPLPGEVLVLGKGPKEHQVKVPQTARYVFGTAGNGTTGGSKDRAISSAVQKVIQSHKSVTPKNEDYFLLENADFSYLPFSETDDIPAELKELIRALNQATENGVELDGIMEEAIRAYLNPQYKGAGIFPPSYLSLLLKLYMDKVNSFQKAWNYVELNTPASSKCQGKECDDISRFAMEALLIQPRFRDQLSQDQWTSVDGIMNYKLSEFKKGSDEYITELVRMMILKEGKEKVQNELETIVEQALAEGKSKEDATLLSIAALLATSPQIVTGEALSLQVSAQYLKRQALVKTVQIILESAEGLATDAMGALAVTVEGATLSASIPISVVGLFTVGVGYALYDAYGFKSPDAKRHMINYVNREISNHSSHTKTIHKTQGNTKDFVSTQSQVATAHGNTAPTEAFPENEQIGSNIMHCEAVPWDASMGLVGSSIEEMNCQEDPNPDKWGGSNDKNWWNHRFSRDAATSPFVEKLNAIKTSGKFKSLTKSSSLEEWISTMRQFRAANNLTRDEQMVLRRLEQLNKTGIPKRKFVNSANPNNAASSYTKVSWENGEWVAEAEIATKVPSRNLFDIFAPDLLESIKNAVCSADSVIDIIKGQNGYLRYSSHERGGGHIHYIRQEEDYICNESIKFDEGDDFVDLARLMLCN